MALTDSCSPHRVKPELISVKSLSRFPSASAIEYHAGKIFLFGDDAAYLLVLDTAYRQLDTIRYTNDTAYRIPKQIKPDIEAAALISINHQKYLCALGSFSTGQRRKVFAFPLNDLHSFFSLTILLEP